MVGALLSFFRHRKRYSEIPATLSAGRASNFSWHILRAPAPTKFKALQQSEAHQIAAPPLKFMECWHL